MTRRLRALAAIGLLCLSFVVRPPASAAATATPAAGTPHAQAVVRAVDDGRHPRQDVAADAAGQMPGDERRTGQRPVAHGPQRQGARAGHRPGTGAQAGRHLAGAHALEAHRLILHQQNPHSPLPILPRNEKVVRPAPPRVRQDSAARRARRHVMHP